MVLLKYFLMAENPLIESNDEQSLASEIERDLSEVLILFCFEVCVID